MVLPDVERLLCCVHESAHYVVALAFGFEVTAAVVHDEPVDGRRGACFLPEQPTRPTHHRLIQLLAGAVAAGAAFPKVDRTVIAAGGCDDFVRAQQLVCERFAAADRQQVYVEAMEATERVVAELGPEIVKVAGRLWAEARVASQSKVA